ncbi:MAG: YaeQ family protein [Gammaproteobacteria bacterium]|nr:YaeQ family protein [Gammaproteobacteria bacterium]
MASNATIFKATLQIADMDRQYYADHALTVARHPSETDERMMVRLLAFVRHAHESLVFGRGLSAEDEPDLWRKDLTGVIELWIEVGQPEEKRLRRACNRAAQVVVYNYGGRGADLWWEQNREALGRQENLTVLNLPYESSRALAGLAQRSMLLQCTVQDGQVWLGDGQNALAVELDTRMKAGESVGR